MTFMFSKFWNQGSCCKRMQVKRTSSDHAVPRQLRVPREGPVKQVPSVNGRQDSTIASIAPDSFFYAFLKPRFNASRKKCFLLIALIFEIEKHTFEMG
jgi:hypothetical protein